MISVTSDEKKRIEGQMKTALPYLNEQIDSVIEIVHGKERSILTFKLENDTYELPIFYVSPSADDTEWEVMLNQMEEAKDINGVFLIRFHSGQHLIHNASTYALTNMDLYGHHMLSDMSRLCNYIDLEPYKLQLFDAAAVKEFLIKLRNAENEEANLKDIEESNAVVIKEVEKKPVVEEQKKVEEKVVKVDKPVTKEKPVTPVVSPKSDADIDSDIRALINDCFGIF